MNADRKTLQWYFDDGELRANHPFYHDDGVGLFYSVRESPTPGLWVASFEGSPVTRGQLSEVLTQVEIDAFSPVGIPVGIDSRGGK